MFILPSNIVLALSVILVIALVELYFFLGRYTILNVQAPEFDPESESPGDNTVIPATGDLRFVKNWIVTHTDFDGYTSGALLLRHLGKDASISFSSPGKLLSNLTLRSQGLVQGDSITIADLALQPHQEHEFADLLNALRNRGIRVIWIDHHQWPSGLVDRIRSLCHDLEVDTTQKTAAALIRKRMPADDHHAERLLKFVQNRSDDADAEWDKIWRFTLAELSHKRDPELNDRVLRLWADNKPGGILRAHLARRGYKREQTTEAIALHQHRREKTAHSRTFLVIDVRSRRLEMDQKGRYLYVINGAQPSMMVGRKACQSQHADFCLIVWEDFRYSVYRGLDSSVDFKPLMGQKTINKTIYRVGGHHYAVSIRVAPTLTDRMKSLFRFRLGKETEQIIDILKQSY